MLEKRTHPKWVTAKVPTGDVRICSRLKAPDCKPKFAEGADAGKERKPRTAVVDIGIDEFKTTQGARLFSAVRDARARDDKRDDDLATAAVQAVKRDTLIPHFYTLPRIQVYNTTFEAKKQPRKRKAKIQEKKRNRDSPHQKKKTPVYCFKSNQCKRTSKKSSAIPARKLAALSTSIVN